MDTGNNERRLAADVRPAGNGVPKRADIAWIMQHLRRALPDLEVPAVEKIAEKSRKDAFRVLIGTLLSARTQDATTHAASMRLFARAASPRTMARLTIKEIERLIYPVSFYRTKAVHVKATCELLMKRFGGRVPETMEELLTLPGVGRKTANLVLIVAHGSRRNICVDTHVHRISNRLGWVATRTPDETEQALYRAIPRRWWPDVNLYLVIWGQNVCRPIGPRCGACVLAARCPSRRVTSRPQGPGAGDRGKRPADTRGRAPHASRDTR